MAPLVGIAELSLDHAEPRVEARLGARRLAALREERLERLGIPSHARAGRRGRSRCPSLPRSTAAAAGGRSAAAPTPRRSRCRRGTRAPRPRGPGRACRPSTSRPRWRCGRTPSSSPRSYARASRSAVSVAASDSMHRSARTLLISGWSTSSLPNAERCAAWCVACSTAVRIAGGRAEHAVEPRVVDHLDDRRHAAALLADEPCPRRRELDLARRVRAVAELVLQPLDVKAVARPVRQHARDEEAREPAVGLRKHEERVAHRRRAEPLVPVELVLAVSERPRDGRRSRERRSRPAARSSPSRRARRASRRPASVPGRSRAT